jgi:hypothetical protein
MKVYKNKYRYHWVSPYTICEKICFWREIDYDEPWVKQTNKILEPVMTAWMKFLDIVHPKVDYVKIDYWDVWSMDSTLSPIILPMLKKLKEVKHGAPFIDDEDVPERLRSTTKAAIKSKKNTWDTDCNHFKRFDWVLDEMIWAFEQLCNDDWESQFFSGESDIQWVKNNDGTSTMKRGLKDTRKWDKKGYMKHDARITNGTRLFGKYFRALWD